MSADPTARMLDLIEASPTPFHAVAEVSRQLAAAGFTRLREGDAWELKPGTKAWTVRNDASLIAFVVGQEPPARAGWRVIGAHTDSPNLRLKPKAAYVKEGFRQLGLEVYGGVLLHTWLDRDLALAGRVFVEGEAEARLVRLKRAFCRVPSLAIHLNREVNEKGLVVNPQEHLPAIAGLETDPADPDWLRKLVAREAGVEPGALLEWDLMLHDVVPPTRSGAHGEFVHAPRLDNLASCHAALEALLAAGSPAATCVIALWDHEEVGSASAEGAGSPFLATVLERIGLALGASEEDRHRALARSFCVSADMAHALHPNHADRHESRHQPRLGAGPVLKMNHNQRYATNAATANAFLRAAKAAEVPVQRFVTRTDLPCGSTIGPITAARLGIPVVDVGNPMLSMHSIREMASAVDQDAMIRVLARVLADA